MNEVEFFRDAIVELGRVTQALWTLNVSVMLASAGWAVTSRSWAKGLHPLVCAVAVVVLIAFYALNLGSLNGFYIRLDAAVIQLEGAWSRVPDEKGQIGSIFSGLKQDFIETPLGKFAPFLLFAFAGQALMAIGVGVLLSGVGRSRQATHDNGGSFSLSDLNQ